MPAEEPQHSAEAVRRALPALVKLQRYERRAVAKRDQAIRALAFHRSIAANNLDLGPCLQNEANFHLKNQRVITVRCRPLV